MSSCHLGLLAVLVTLLAATSVVHGYQCAKRPLKFGCFRDNGGKRLMKIQFTLSMAPKDWVGEGWNTYLLILFCDCSKVAEREGYRYFGLQNYNECWTGNLDDVANIDSRRAKDNMCWSKTPSYLECTKAKQFCVGTPWHMAIYETTFDSLIILPKTEEPTIKTITIKPQVHRPPPKIPKPPSDLTER